MYIFDKETKYAYDQSVRPCGGGTFTISSVADPHHQPEPAFTLMRIQIRILQLTFFPDWDLPMLQNNPVRLPPFHFNADADPDQAFHSDADPEHSFHFDGDLDPAFHFDADPDPVS